MYGSRVSLFRETNCKIGEKQKKKEQKKPNASPVKIIFVGECLSILIQQHQ